MPKKPLKATREQLLEALKELQATLAMIDAATPHIAAGNRPEDGAGIPGVIGSNSWRVFSGKSRQYWLDIAMKPIKPEDI
jgi:hypothetical protein